METFIKMPKELIFILFGLLLGAWFLLDSRRSAAEKFGFIFLLAVIYFVYLYIFNGPSIMKLLKPYIR